MNALTVCDVADTFYTDDNSASKISRENGGNELTTELPDPLVPEGAYRVAFVGYTTRKTMYGPKLYLRFSIISPVDFAGINLYRYYNVKRLTTADGPGGGFALSPKGDAFRELTRLLNVRLRPDRIPMTRLKQIRLVAEVSTVSHDSKGLELHEYTRYSKIERLHRVDGEDDRNESLFIPSTRPYPSPIPSPIPSPNPPPTINPEPSPKPHPTFSEESWAAIGV